MIWKRKFERDVFLEVVFYSQYSEEPKKHCKRIETETTVRCCLEILGFEKSEFLKNWAKIRVGVSILN